MEAYEEDRRARQEVKRHTRNARHRAKFVEGAARGSIAVKRGIEQVIISMNSQRCYFAQMGDDPGNLMISRSVFSSPPSLYFAQSARSLHVAHKLEHVLE